MTRFLAALINPLARVGNWLLDTQLDERICRLSNQLSGDTDD